jgi:hypothetical protein
VSVPPWTELRRIHRGELEVDAEHHAALLLRVAAIARERLTGLSMRGLDGAPDWLGYETQLWEISEDLRQHLRTRRRKRGRQPLMDAVAEIVADPAYGKGRQNFVLVLGRFGGPDYADLIARGLDHPDVCAHALHALRLQTDDRFVAQARRMLARPTSGAARDEARRYLKRFASDEQDAMG